MAEKRPTRGPPRARAAPLKALREDADKGVMKLILPLAFYGLMVFGRQVGACLYLLVLGDVSVGELAVHLIDALPK